ncbi:MAG: TadE/TadG family type IV pilus assembly protein [Allosphingosinicella sp.]
MMKFLRRDQRGIGAVEFALVAPVLITFIVGISQMGKLFFANADMHNAVAAGARVAAVWPVPGDDAIIAAIHDRLVRTGAAAKTHATITHGTDSNGNAYADITMTYTVPLDFIFFEVPAVTLHDTRRIFTQVTDANSTSYVSTTGTTTSGGTTGTTTTTTGGTTTSGGTTTTGGTTTSGGTTTTGGTTSSTGGTTTTTGGTTSTSSTSASSTSASSTSASSTGGTSATSTSSTSSGNNASSGNASSGNASSTSTSSTSSTSTGGTTTTSSSSSSGNGNSSGNSDHQHGNCTKKC